MTKSNRTMNRIILFVLGLVAVVVGLTIGAGVLPAVQDAIKPYVDLPSNLDVSASSLWIVAAACAVVIVLALVWAFSRGRGGTSVAVRERSGEDAVTVNVALVRDVVEHELAGVRDVVGSRVDTYLVRKQRAARIRVAVRRGGDAVSVLDAVDRAVAVLDRTLGRQVPVLVHLTGGTRSALAKSTRVH
ncbi:FtsX-like permease family protein [Curtobacterium sp. 24E2]|nr:FtsX-like permease family protein [Curtobacterium sp. 24E2]